MLRSEMNMIGHDLDTDEGLIGAELELFDSENPVITEYIHDGPENSMLDILTPLFPFRLSPVPPDIEEATDDWDNVDFIEKQPEEQSGLSQLKQILMKKPNPPKHASSVSIKHSSSTLKHPGISVIVSDKPMKTSSKKHQKIQKNNPHISIDQPPNGTLTDTASKENEKHEKSEVKSKQTLKFPPCAICGGTASGLHYGVNSCEACKGFFRRYIVRNEEYHCTSGGQCKIVNRNRENCSGCRLKKCLELGMSKEKSKLGRYTLSRRTETIKKVNTLEGKVEKDPLEKRKFVSSKKVKSNSKSRKVEPCAHSVVAGLVMALEGIKRYAKNIDTNEDIQNVLEYHHNRYRAKVEVYGEMRSVPNHEYYKLLKEYGIDLDGRLSVLKEYMKETERLMENYLDFANQIPEFSKLSENDRQKLLMASRCDFFIIFLHEGYSHDYKIIVSKTGVGYHIDELSDKCFSREMIVSLSDMYHRWQCLNLSKAEKALLIAITLVSTERCLLDDHDRVENIQMTLIELLRKQLDLTCKKSSRQRFGHMIDCLTLMRNTSERYLNEYAELCKDEVVIQEIPKMKDFLLADW